MFVFARTPTSLKSAEMKPPGGDVRPVRAPRRGSAAGTVALCSRSERRETGIRVSVGAPNRHTPAAPVPTAGAGRAAAGGRAAAAGRALTLPRPRAAPALGPRGAAGPAHRPRSAAPPPCPPGPA